MIPAQESSLIVYKLFCFNGEPKVAQVIQDDKLDNESIDYFDMNWTLMDLKTDFPNSEFHIAKPTMWDEMKQLARKFSVGIPFIRVDFYEIQVKLYFSEFTFYSDAGYANFSPDKWDKVLGEWINLR
ncbi:TupA-like ATPgrasp [Selenomonas ruminantium]|uniref:TupA-like ATPgrasp n=2 Tax=Selenomonas ruminantium TaxID=971 RepID=A0A1I0YMG2_SELRU|nr:TupA-like ATPgrasp [Selenomonas ruminantium]